MTIEKPIQRRKRTSTTTRKSVIYANGETFKDLVGVKYISHGMINKIFTKTLIQKKQGLIYISLRHANAEDYYKYPVRNYDEFDPKYRQTRNYLTLDMAIELLDLINTIKLENPSFDPKESSVDYNELNRLKFNTPISEDTGDENDIETAA